MTNTTAAAMDRAGVGTENSRTKTGIKRIRPSVSRFGRLTFASWISSFATPASISFIAFPSFMRTCDSDHAGPQQIMQMDHALDGAGLIQDHERGDRIPLHDLHGARGQVIGADRLRIRRGDQIARPALAHVAAALQ